MPLTNAIDRVTHTGAPASLSAIEQAIWRTVAYMDVFDFPPTGPEIHRYLEGVTAAYADIDGTLQQSDPLSQHLTQIGRFYTLSGREETVSVRQNRMKIAHALWPAAIAYGRLIANLPFVRMVAVTGSLTMDNVDKQGDIDYLIITKNGRVWISRAFAVAIVRLAARRGYNLCPNYILAERALHFSDHNLYIAHEIVQMVPLSGRMVYRQLRQANAWADSLLPNANGPPRDLLNKHQSRYLLRQLAELPLRTPAGQWLEQWEMQRKLQKFNVHWQKKEAAFSEDWCKGHFNAHRQNTLTAYQKTVGRSLEDG